MKHLQVFSTWSYHRSKTGRMIRGFLVFRRFVQSSGWAPSAGCKQSCWLSRSQRSFSLQLLEEEKALFPFPHPLVLSACGSSQIIHSRAKSQSLSLSFSECLHGPVHLPTPPPYYSLLLSSPPLFQPQLGRGGGGREKIHDTCDVLQRTVSQPIGVHESCGCIREIEIWIEKAIEPDRECKKKKKKRSVM